MRYIVCICIFDASGLVIDITVLHSTRCHDPLAVVLDEVTGLPVIEDLVFALVLHGLVIGDDANVDCLLDS